MAIRQQAYVPMISLSPVRFFSSSTSRLNQANETLEDSSSQSKPKVADATKEIPSFFKTPKNKVDYLTVSQEELLPLKLGGDLYATVHIHDRKFLVTEGDEIILPVRLRDAEVGDVLEFNKISTLGTREHTLTGSPAIDPSIFRIKGVVVEKTRDRVRVHERTQRRVRHVRHVVKQNCITIIRVSELQLN